MNLSKRIVNSKKLVNSKWTAVAPVNKEKHFIVTKVIPIDSADLPIEHVELEAVYSGRSQLLRWQQLNDTNVWLQGWV
ncbi:MAG TPA: TIGR02450 family Trp-rich protein [Methylotenera mobilis]|jgi:tryptophan-rich hypothetical protein|uniref:TIGR02450 family Trp-rich protein n=1 Tax=Methylotenera mobilis TaxID=359408 RepID=A0A351RAK2_9PROT|nr:TIGR02450 family Trp-rich protein [Methylotenera mobilis]